MSNSNGEQNLSPPRKFEKICHEPQAVAIKIEILPPRAQLIGPRPLHIRPTGSTLIH